MPFKPRKISEPEIYSEIVEAPFGGSLGLKVQAAIAVILAVALFAVSIVFRDNYVWRVLAFTSGFALLVILIMLIRLVFMWDKVNKYRISMTAKYIAVSYQQACKAIVPWRDIVDCYADESFLSAYRMNFSSGGNRRSSNNEGCFVTAVIDGKSRLAYIQQTAPRLVLRLNKAYEFKTFGVGTVDRIMQSPLIGPTKGQRFTEFVFSTNNPDQVKDIIKQHIGKQEK